MVTERKPRLRFDWALSLWTIPDPREWGIQQGPPEVVVVGPGGWARVLAKPRKQVRVL